MITPRSRSGVSLVEVLVAVAALAVLVGLLLGGVQKVRERAVAARLQNNMRQLLLATQNYAGGRGGQLPNVDGKPPNQGRAPLLALGPDLGQPAAAVARDEPAPLLRADGLDPTLPTGPAPTLTPDNADELRPWYAVSFAVNPHLFADGARLDRTVPDGLSNTAAFTTHFSNCHRTLFMSATLSTQSFDSSGRPVPVTNPAIHRATFADLMADDVHPVRRVANGVASTAGSQPRTFQSRPAVADCDYRVPQSLTAGGLTVGFADGSVRTLRGSIAEAVFWGAVTPAGGETLAWND